MTSEELEQAFAEADRHGNIDVKQAFVREVIRRTAISLRSVAA